MVSTFTPNINLEEPARGDDVGTWDTPVNSNATVLDLTLGAVTTIGVNNSNIVLSAAQFRSAVLTFNSTLTGSITITFPTSFIKPYTIGNVATGSSAFVITLATTASGGQVVCAPPGEYIDVVNDGTNLRFRNLGRVGEYMDIAATSVPAWITGCTVPPYLACTGGSFSSVTYPALAALLGGTTLPDSRGRNRMALDAGVGRVSSATCSVPGNTLFGAGGDQQLTQHNHTATVNDPQHTHGTNAQIMNGGPGGIGASGSSPNTATINSAATGITVSIGFTGNGGSQNMSPTYVGGITMIRAG